MGSETLSRRDVFWGSDLSTRAASIGWATADGSSRGVVTAIWEDRIRGGERLASAHACIYTCARELARVRPAVFVYVEQPRATGSSMELTYMCGVVQLAIYEALWDHWRTPVEIRTVPPSRWKKEVLGRGDYRKPKRNEDFEYQALVWCRENGVEVADDNEGDAVCIAEHARLAVSFV